MHEPRIMNHHFTLFGQTAISAKMKKKPVTSKARSFLHICVSGVACRGVIACLWCLDNLLTDVQDAAASEDPTVRIVSEPR